MKLFIVESPHKCVTIRKHLGSDYKVEASVGHIRAIPRKGMNIDIKGGFIPKFEVMDGKAKVIKGLKESAEKADIIYLATDPDREGEAIAWHIYDMFNKKCQAKCKRVTYNEINKKAILRAIDNAGEIDMDMVNSQKARQVLDRLIGYKVSPVLWYTVGKGTSAGRVQSVALKIICERHKEIDAFKPTDFWYIESLLQNDNGEFWGKVVTKDKDNRYLDEKLSTADKKVLETAAYTVDKIEKKEKINKAYPPFDTPSLQSGCSALFKWSGVKTMKVAQSLYEKGKVSYIRSDSYNISDEAVEAVRTLISKAASAEYLPKSPIKYQKKKGTAQEAHECIRPSDCYEKGDDLIGDEAKLYKLIRDRFIACQMSAQVVDTVAYHIKTDTKHKLLATGQSIKFDGWSKVYKYSKSKEVILPVVEEKEKLSLKDIKRTKHSTKPPPRYNHGSLVKKMDQEGVGRPSTLASITKALLDKEYIENEKDKKGGAFVATILGLKICDYLEPHFKDFFMDIKYTAALEEDIAKVAEGKETYLNLVTKVYGVLTDHLKEAKENQPEKKPAEKMGTKCAKCEDGEVVKKEGRYGVFYPCSNYPDCKTVYIQNDEGDFVVKKKAVVKSTGKKCPECEKYGRDGELLERSNKKSGDKFLGCSKWPKCKYSASIDKS